MKQARRAIIDPSRNLFQWGPVDAYPLFLNYFYVGFMDYAKQYISWPNTVEFYSRGRMLIFVDDEELRRSGEKNFQAYIKPRATMRRLYAAWQNDVRHLHRVQDSLEPDQWRHMSNADFHRTYLRWAAAYRRFWPTGLVPELSNWGGEAILARLLQDHVAAAAFPTVYERLSAPDRLSFYQQAEYELLQLKRFTGQPKILQKKLVAYKRRHFWLLNSYRQSRVLPVAHFARELQKVSASDAKKKMRVLQQWPQKVRQDKRAVVKRYHLSREIATVGERIAFCIWWQDQRKSDIFLANHFIYLFLRECSRRYHIPVKDLSHYTARELDAAIKTGRRLPPRLIAQRQRIMLIQYHARSNRMTYDTGAWVGRLEKEFLHRPQTKSNEIKGITVSTGPIVRGTVRVIPSPRDIKKMKQGDILVTGMTSPDFIVALRRAAAVVTDGGGLTSHAAIVSRELGIPCIVGTKVATKVLKNGDRVEVDATKGIVKKL